MGAAEDVYPFSTSGGRRANERRHALTPYVENGHLFRCANSLERASFPSATRALGATATATTPRSTRSDAGATSRRAFPHRLAERTIAIAAEVAIARARAPTPSIASSRVCTAAARKNLALQAFPTRATRANGVSTPKTQN